MGSCFVTCQLLVMDMIAAFSNYVKIVKSYVKPTIMN